MIDTMHNMISFVVNGKHIVFHTALQLTCLSRVKIKSLRRKEERSFVRLGLPIAYGRVGIQLNKGNNRQKWWCDLRIDWGGRKLQECV
jgi:hypothetical protein